MDNNKIIKEIIVSLADGTQRTIISGDKTKSVILLTCSDEGDGMRMKTYGFCNNMCHSLFIVETLLKLAYEMAKTFTGDEPGYNPINTDPRHN